MAGHTLTDVVGPEPPPKWWDQFIHVSTLDQILPWHAAKNPNRIVMHRYIKGDWVAVTVAGLQKDVAYVAGLLRSSGIGPGDHVLIFSRTRYEWLVADNAVWAIGALSVGVHDAAHAEHLRWVLRDMTPMAALVESDDQAHLVATLAADAAPLRVIYRFDAGLSVDPALTREASRYLALEAAPTTWAESYAPGRTNPHDVATVAYTDAGAGRPRGCVISHHNLLAAMTATARALSPISVNPDEALLVYTSMAGIAGRLAVMRALLFGVPMVLSDPARVGQDLEEVGPTVMVANPGFLHRILTTAKARAYAAGKHRQFDAAASAAIKHSEQLTEFAYGKTLRRSLLDGPILSRVRAALGKNLRWVLSSGSRCDPDLAHFFRGIGVAVLEGYGPTEVCGAATHNRPGREAFGTFGPMVPGVELFVGEEGGISVRGPNVFAGYVDEPTTLRRSVDAGGWFTTPDVGAFSGDALVVSGHAGDLLVMSGGTAVDPAPLEEKLRSHPLVAHAVVVGHQRASLGALITLDQDAVSAWRTEHNLSDLSLAQMAVDHGVLSEVRSAVESVNEAVTIGSHIRRLKVLATTFSYADGQLTPSLRIRREAIMRDFAHEVAALYDIQPLPRVRKHG